MESENQYLGSIEVGESAPSTLTHVGYRGVGHASKSDIGKIVLLFSTRTAGKRGGHHYRLNLTRASARQIKVYLDNFLCLDEGSEVISEEQP